MESNPTFKFLKGLNQKPDADITDGLVEATDVSYEKIGSVRSVPVNTEIENFGAPLHSLSIEGLNEVDHFIEGIGTGLRVDSVDVLLGRVLSGSKVRMATHTDRLYFVDSSGTLLYYDPDLSGTFVYKAGSPVPSTAPTVSTGAGVGFTGDYNIKITFTNVHGFDGNPSTAATVTTANNGIDLDVIATNADTNYNVTGRKAWIQGGSNPFYPEYVLLETISDNTTTASLGLLPADVDTTELLETDNDLPSTGYKYIVNHYGVILMAGHDENSLVFSKSARPEQFPVLNSFGISSSGDEIMNLLSWDGVTLIPTRKKIFQMIGSPGQGILQTNFYIKDTKSSYGTIASDSVVPTPYGMFFWSENGIRVFSGNTSEIFSNEVDDEFNGRNKADTPESLTHGSFSDDKVIWSYCYGTATTPNRSLVYDFKTQKWSVHNNGYYAFAADRKNNVLYAGTSTSLEKVYGGSTYRAWAARTMDMTNELNSVSSFKKVRVDMEGECSLEAYMDGTLRKTYSLSTSGRDQVERLLPAYMAQRLSLRFSGTAKSTQDKIYSFRMVSEKEGE